MVRFINAYRYSDIGKSILNVDAWLEAPTKERTKNLDNYDD